MKKLISKYLGGGSVGEQIVDVGKYMIPGVGTYYSWRDVANDPSWTNIGLAALSTLGDATLIFGGAGEGLKVASAAGRATKAAKTAARMETAATKLTKLAKAYDALSRGGTASKYARGEDDVVRIIGDRYQLNHGDMVHVVDLTPKAEYTTQMGKRLDGAVRAQLKQFIAEAERDAARTKAILHTAEAAKAVATGTAAKVPSSIYNNSKKASTNKQSPRKGTGQTPYLNDNSHPWWNPFNTLKKKNGGTILRYQDGGSVGELLIDAGKYMVPVYGTYLSVKDAIDDPSWQNWGLAGLSLLGDIATVAGGSGLLVKGASAASKGAKYAKAAKASEKEAEAMIKYAEKLAPISGKYWTYTEIPSAVTGKTVLKPMAPIKVLKPELTQAVRRTIDGIYADAAGTLRRAASQEMFADMYRQEAINHMKQAGRVAAGGTSVKGGKSIQKAVQSDKLKHTTNNQRLNYVQKDTTKPWWNPF